MIIKLKEEKEVLRKKVLELKLTIDHISEKHMRIPYKELVKHKSMLTSLEIQEKSLVVDKLRAE